ncbi:polycystic kidney disease protein 1-like 2 [Mercenaria mercenaria]|uniref:polycystic kidney disease protein 1-like 2 n=1 Tax=Mercenaria mercenaria TaxID=6596 RepID=UPI00234FA607|nr:polycystic kidney disease protein 1-like 2 [Mercenaria mercenaria]
MVVMALLAWSQRSHVILKVGSPSNLYLTSLYIRITDMFNNYKEIHLSVKSRPAFNVSGITPTADGAALIRSYTEVDYPFDEQQLRDMGKSDMIISLVSAVCSNLHLLELPEWQPPVPRVLNSGGAVLDLAPDGNNDFGTLDEVSAAAFNQSLDPATLAVQDVMSNMTALIRGVVENDLVNGTRKGDKLLTSLISNAFTNLAAKPQFINLDTKANLIYLSKIVGEDALDIENTTEDQSAQIETTSGEVYYMFQAVVNSAVPDDLNQVRPVGDLKSGRTQIENMLSVIGQNISTDNSMMSPTERAFLYMKMQLQLAFQTDEQKNVAREAAKMAIALGKNIQDKLKVCSTCSNEDSNKTNQLVKKNTAKIIQNDVIPTNTSSFRLDGLHTALGSMGTGDELVSVSAYEFNENVFMYDEDGTSSFVTSNILRIDVKTSVKRVTPGFLTFEQNVQTPDAETIKPEVDEEDASEFMYHQFIYQKATDFVCIIALPLGGNNFTDYLVYIKFGGPPSIIDYNLKWTIHQDKNWQICIPPQQMKGNTGLIHLAVRLSENKKEISYNFTLITVACLTWEEDAAKWHSDKCTLEWLPQSNKISCFCQDVTDMVFANSFFVAPNSIDFATVFLKFSPLSQAAVLGTLISMLLIYIIAIVVLKRLDRRDTLKWGITPLRDNLIDDKNYYIIKVYTGMRRGAGTTSRIAFILTGSKGDTGVRELFDGIRTEVSTGSVMSFFMATKAHLGDIKHLYIWHDNSGEDDSDSWYPNQVEVFDIEKRNRYTFVIERWLSLETSLEALIDAIPSGLPVQFESRFFYQTRDRLSESHMWVSILYRPQISSFTRVQRSSCALVYIFLTMISNAMFFNPEPEYQSPPLIQVGPLRFTAKQNDTEFGYSVTSLKFIFETTEANLHFFKICFREQAFFRYCVIDKVYCLCYTFIILQIYISLVCALMTTPVTMILIFIFKRTKCKQSTEKTSYSCTGSKCMCPYGALCLRKSDKSEKYEVMLKSRMLSSAIPDFNGGLYLPGWFMYVAWFLFFLGTMVPALFILLYSMEWGKQKSEEWLTTFFMSLLESMFFVDPIMVICLAFILALLIRTNKADTNVDTAIIVSRYKEMMGDGGDAISSSIKVLKSIQEDHMSYMTTPRTVDLPLEGSDLEQAANKHRQHVQLMTTIKDTLFNLFFMLIILTICFSNRDSRSYLHYTETVNTIVEPLKMPHFHSISTPGDLFVWLDTSVIPSLFPEFDMNGAPLHWTVKQFTTGYVNLRLGPPRLRQLRTKKGTCDIPYIGKVSCYGEYTILDEEEKNYCIGWQTTPCPKLHYVYNVSVDAWTFKSAFEVWGLHIPGEYTTYGGGGYIATLDVGRDNSVAILNELFKNLWIDRQTRAVMFEFTLYNGATNMFIYNVFLVEFPETGGAFTSFSIYPIRVYTHQGASGTLTLICEIAFAIYLIVLLIKICIRIYQQRCGYFKQFWQVYEIVMLVTGVTSIVIYAIRLVLTAVTIDKFKTDRRQFVDFSHIVLWDQVLVSFLAILVFMATLRILEVFATTKKVGAVVKVFQDCGKDLFWYGITFLYIFMGFCFLGMLLFGSELFSYSTVYQCMGTLFTSMIGKSKFTEINETQPILAKVYFMFYILTVVFFVLTIFLSILGASIDKVVHDIREDTREDIIEIMMNKIKSLFGKPTTTKEKANMDTKQII